MDQVRARTPANVRKNVMDESRMRRRGVSGIWRRIKAPAGAQLSRATMAADIVTTKIKTTHTSVITIRRGLFFRANHLGPECSATSHHLFQELASEDRQSGIRGKPDEPALLYIVFFAARRKMYEDKWTAKLLGER